MTRERHLRFVLPVHAPGERAHEQGMRHQRQADRPQPAARAGWLEVVGVGGDLHRRGGSARSLNRQADAFDPRPLQGVHRLDHGLVLDALVGADDHGDLVGFTTF